MGLFNLGKNKKIKIYAPTNGKFQALEDVADEVFSQKAMGEGFGIIPNSSKIYAPIDGKVVSIFKTKHAIGIKTKKGAEILIHMGLDTVELNGDPFDILVREGDEVSKGVQLANMNVQKVKDAGKDPVVLTLVTNVSEIAKDFNITISEKKLVQHGDLITEIAL